MPLFLEPERFVNVPLEATYQTAFAVQPERWKRVLEACGPH
jgi:predicted methyltransferase